MPRTGNPPKRRDIAQLIEALRARQLPITAGEATDAVRVTAYLADTAAPDRQTYDALRTALRCVLCKSSTDQPAFDDVYDSWSTEPPPPPRDDRLADLVRKRLEQLRRRRITRADLFGAALLLLSILTLSLWRPWQSDAPPRTASVATTATADMSAADKPAAPTQPPVRSADIASGPMPRTVGNSTTFAPSLRVNEEVRPVWLWLPALCLLVAIALLAAAALPRLRLSRNRGTGNRDAKPWPRSRYEHLLAGVLSPATQARLRRHLLRAHDEHDDDPRRALPDLRRTVEAAASRLDLPRLHFRAARRRPSYLVFVCAETGDSYPMQWASRLADLDIRVDRFLVSDLDSTSPRCTEVGGSGRRFTFDQLPAPEPGQRLIVLAPLPALFEDAPAISPTPQQHLRPWWQRAHLERWRQRALFALDEPRYWIENQVEAIERHMPGDPGMVVLPLDDNAIGAWSEWLVSGRLPAVVLTDFQRYPTHLHEHPMRFVDNAPFEEVADKRKDSADRVADTITQLQAHLGRNGFYWLCACAVAPVLTRDLALLLGERYFLNCGTPSEEIAHYLAQNWRKLARLPWLDGTHQMPQWLRLLLLQRLPDSVQNELRAVIRDVLVPADVDGAGNLPVSLDDERDTRSQASTQNQVLFIGFIEEGLTAEQLLLRVSVRWARLARKAMRAPRWHRRIAAGAARWTWRDGLASRGIRTRVVMLLLLGFAAPVTAFAWLATVDLSALPMEVRWQLLRESTYAVAAHVPERIDEIAYGQRMIATASRRQVRFWDAATATPTVRPLAANGEITAIALDDKDTLVAVATAENITVHRLPSLAPVSTITAPGVSSLAFGADGQLNAITRGGAPARAWRVSDAAPLPARRGLDVCADSLRADKGALLAVRLSAGQLTACSPSSAGLLVRDDDVVAATYVTGNRIAAVLRDNTFRLLVAPGALATAELTTFPIAVEPGTLRIAASASGNDFVTATANSFQVWNAPDHLHPNVYAISGSLAATMSADERLVGLVRDDGRADLLDARNAQHIATLTAAERMAFSPDGRFVVTSQAGSSQLWQLYRYGRLDPFIAAQYATGNVVFSPDGRRLFAWDEGETSVNEFPGLTRIRTFLTSPAAIASSRDGMRLAVIGRDGSTELLDMQSRIFGPAFRAALSNVAISPDGSRVAGIDGDNLLVLYYTVSWTRADARESALSDVTALDFSADSTLLVTASRDGLRVWDGRTIAPIGDLETRQPPKVTADRASGSGEETPEPAVDTDRSVTARFAPNGNRLASATRNGTIRIWDASTRRLVREFHGTHFLAGPPRIEWNAAGDALLVGGTRGMFAGLLPDSPMAYRLRVAADAPVANTSTALLTSLATGTYWKWTFVAAGVALLTVVLRARRRLARGFSATVSP